MEKEKVMLRFYEELEVETILDNDNFYWENDLQVCLLGFICFVTSNY